LTKFLEYAKFDMLYFSSHNQFAKKQHLEREHRLLCVTGDDDNSTAHPEAGPEQTSGSPESSSASSAQVKHMQEGFSERLQAQEDATWENLSRSPTVLLTVLEGNMLSDELQQALESNIRAHDSTLPQNIPVWTMVEFIRTHGVPEVERKLLDEIQTILADPEKAIGIGGELERRILRYRDLEQSLSQRYGNIIGPIDLEKIEKFEADFERIFAEDGYSLRDFIAGTNEKFATVNKKKILALLNEKFGLKRNPIAGDLQFESPDENATTDSRERYTRRTIRKTLEAAKGWLKHGKESTATADLADAATGEVTRTNMARRFLGALKFARIRKLMATSLNVGGAEENRIAETDTLKELESQLLGLKQHIDNILQEQAGTLHTQLVERLNRKFFAQKDADLITLKEDDTGITPEELGYDVLAPALTLPQRILRLKPEDVCEDEEHDVAPDVTDEHYLNYAGRALSELNAREEWEAEELKLAQEQSRPPRNYEDVLFEDAQENHDQNIAWAKREAPRLSRLMDEEGSGANTERMHLLQKVLGRQIRANGQPMTEQDIATLPEMLTYLEGLLQRIAGADTPSRADYDELYQTVDRFGLSRLTFIFDTLANPSAMQKMDRYAEKQAQRPMRENTKETRNDIEDRLRNVRERLRNHPALDLTVSNTFDLKEGFNQKCAEVTSLLDPAETFAETEGRSVLAGQELNRADELTEMLEQCTDRLDAIMREDGVLNVSAERFREITKQDGRAAYVRSDPAYKGKILMNTSADAQFYQTDLAHERGHAVLHAVTSEEFGGLFEGLHIEIYSMIKNDVPEAEKENRDIQAILLGMADRWGVPESKDPNERMELLMDELMNQYATWVDRGRPRKRLSIPDQPPPDDELLFQYMDRKFGKAPPDDSELSLENKPDAEELEKTQAMLMKGSGEEEEAPSARAGRQEPDSAHELRHTEQDVEKIRTFYTAYPEYRAQLEEHYLSAREYFDKIEYTYNHRTDVPVKNIMEALDIIKNFVKPILDEINKEKSKRLNLADEAPKGKITWRTLGRRVSFISIMDIVEAGKQMWEDVNRIWKRRGQAKQAEFGAGVTGWIPDWVPYAGRLKNEFNKRNLSSELEEVSHWKDALKESDSYTLQDLLRSSRNKDQIRAICELLTERGRLDWNDEGMWETFNELSSYEMPIKACRLDAVLRDKWLQKLITSIWGDKDHYFNWRQSNDGAIKSSMSKFTSTVDQLSNVSGGMDGLLKNMLQTFVRFDKDRSNMPEEVNPHLYEETIFYAMRNGKMTMEGKFFYLIQGIRYGLISIDRLGVIAGEGGGILNTFPFIDYFYKKNNSMAEITALSERLEEGPGDDRFSPGLKTTLFVRLEIEREKAVKERLRKGVSKQGENIDHDDIPYFLPALEYSGIKEWFANMSGARQKLSKEALKNAYVGYSMKFKTFAALATMDSQGIQRFTQTDVRDMAQTIGAYVMADNILMRNAFDKDDTSRPELSLSEINTQQPVMGAEGTTVKTYRDNLKYFSQEVLKKFLSDDKTWEEINLHAGNSPTDKGSKEWITQEDFAGWDPEHNRAEPKKAGKIFNATGKMIELLEKNMLARSGEFKQMLIEISKQKNTVTGNEFFTEDGVVKGKEYTNSNIAEIVKRMQ